MGFWKDEECRRFFGRLAVILAVASILMIAIWQMWGGWIKKSAIQHDMRIVSSLMEQGVSESVIARALREGESTGEGAELLARIGLFEETEIIFMPEVFRIQVKTGMLAAGVFLLLWISLLSLTGLFFSAREKLYDHASGVIEGFMAGDFSKHLPRMEEGCLYRLFGKIDGLANALSARNEEVEGIKDFLKDTISDISHQLKTPLSALGMYNEIIESEVDNREAVLKFSQKTAVSLMRVEELIQMLLKITRLDAGAVVFEKQSWSLPDVVSRAVEELLVRAEKEGKELVLTGEEVLINCDLQWTGEAIGNLVKNALDHTDPGGKITVSWKKSAEVTRVSVSDDGEGIDEKDIYHIFKRFYRAGKGSSRGTGLGLPLAKSIVEGQGGTLSVQSSAGAGTVFTIMLPNQILTKL